MSRPIIPSILIALALLISTSAHAVGTAINETGDPPDPSAILDVQSTSKGFLPPRMTEIERNAIDPPTAGLIVYQTDGIAGLYYYDGAVWKDVAIAN